MAKFRSEMLRRCLGGVCANCGEDNLTLLTIDHIDGVTYDRYALRYDARVEQYVREWAEGWARLRVLCMPCNGRFGRMTQEREPGADEGEEFEVAPVTQDVTEEDPPF